ncbi:MAG: hypothetical protein Q9182_006418 [Xanthomendoza sp. 2 TL-2023]
MDLKSSNGPLSEKQLGDDEKGAPAPPAYSGVVDQHGPRPGEPRELSRALKGRHMQMIAIGMISSIEEYPEPLLIRIFYAGGSIGAGLFVGSGGALHNGGPASLLLGFIIIGAMLLFTIQALGELAVLYPVNGAFYMYAVRFIDPAWGFAMGWEYALSWLVILPFEITAAGITIDFWRDDINIGVWIAVFLTTLVLVQFFAVRGYGEVEFVLGIIKIIAVIGFIFLGVIIDCGGVPTDSRGYIGAQYWHDPGAFRNGFKGFCSVFVTAAFAFAGTELVGLAAAEAEDPRKTLPKATRTVFWRIAIFYVLSLFILGLIVQSDSEALLGASGANTKYSPFVLAIREAGVKGLPSVFNAVITLSVISVANSATFASTRTLQALAKHGMAPRFLQYVDPQGRPLWCIVLQLVFGLLAFINEADVGTQVFTWLLSLSALNNLFVWASICLSHIRFRRGWAAQGHTTDELPFKAAYGVIGSYIGFFLNVVALVATFYVSLFVRPFFLNTCTTELLADQYPPQPIGSDPNAEAFFTTFLSAPIAIALYVGWKIYLRGAGGFYVRSHQMDLMTGLRDFNPEVDGTLKEKKFGVRDIPSRLMHAVFV